MVGDMEPNVPHLLTMAAAGLQKLALVVEMVRQQLAANGSPEDLEQVLNTQLMKDPDVQDAAVTIFSAGWGLIQAVRHPQNQKETKENVHDNGQDTLKRSVPGGGDQPGTSETTVSSEPDGPGMGVPHTRNEEHVSDTGVSGTVVGTGPEGSEVHTNPTTGDDPNL
jgi:hypothetical protein